MRGMSSQKFALTPELVERYRGGIGIKRLASELEVAHVVLRRRLMRAGVYLGNRGIKSPGWKGHLYTPEELLEKELRQSEKEHKIYLARNKHDEHVRLYRKENRLIIARERNRQNAKRMWVKNRSNPQYRLSKALRIRIWKVCKRQGAIKYRRTFNLTGCTREELIAHLERQFDHHMNWLNYGTYWEIDHIIPCSVFNLVHIDEQRKCFHFSNLRPLSVTLNRQKHDLITEPQQMLMV